jgi:hypothetical protein
MLQKQLPDALHVAETREREVYGVRDAEEIERVLQSYRDFVALCARKEHETGIPCLIVADFQPPRRTVPLTVQSVPEAFYQLARRIHGLLTRG